MVAGAVFGGAGVAQTGGNGVAVELEGPLRTGLVVGAVVEVEPPNQTRGGRGVAGLGLAEGGGGGEGAGEGVEEIAPGLVGGVGGPEPECAGGGEGGRQFGHPFRNAGLEEGRVGGEPGGREGGVGGGGALDEGEDARREGLGVGAPDEREECLDEAAGLADGVRRKGLGKRLAGVRLGSRGGQKIRRPGGGFPQRVEVDDGCGGSVVSVVAGTQADREKLEAGPRGLAEGRLQQRQQVRRRRDEGLFVEIRVVDRRGEHVDGRGEALVDGGGVGGGIEEGAAGLGEGVAGGKGVEVGAAAGQDAERGVFGAFGEGHGLEEGGVGQGVAPEIKDAGEVGGAVEAERREADKEGRRKNPGRREVPERQGRAGGKEDVEALGKRPEAVAGEFGIAGKAVVIVVIVPPPGNGRQEFQVGGGAAFHEGQEVAEGFQEPGVEPR